MNYAEFWEKFILSLHQKGEYIDFLWRFDEVAYTEKDVQITVEKIRETTPEASCVYQDIIDGKVNVTADLANFYGPLKNLYFKCNEHLDKCSNIEPAARIIITRALLGLKEGIDGIYHELLTGYEQDSGEDLSGWVRSGSQYQKDGRTVAYGGEDSNKMLYDAIGLYLHHQVFCEKLKAVVSPPELH